MTFPASAQKVLMYNEQKAARGEAECIGGENFLGVVSSFTPQQKLSLFQHRNSLNDRAATKMIHISLNFDASEKISQKRLLEIASVYMDKIGFGKQPYFVYEHNDARHPHIHIVSTGIRPDGTRINTHNLGRTLSSAARKDIEVRFRLRQTGEKRKLLSEPFNLGDSENKLWGKGSIKNTISEIVAAVTGQFNVTTIPELNAVLRLYNVAAEKGKVNSRIHAHSGLSYRLLDGIGFKTGKAIKASALHGKPTLKWLEARFEENRHCRWKFKGVLKQTLESVMAMQPADFSSFRDTLGEKGIFVSFGINSPETNSEPTFIDTINKSVFQANEIGIEYTAAALAKRIGFPTNNPTDAVKSIVQKKQAGKTASVSKTHANKLSGNDFNDTLVRQLLIPVETQNNFSLPGWQKKGNRKKKRNDL